VRLLLDTHVIIWIIENSPRLSPSIRELIFSPWNSVAISAASLWEMAIKINNGKLDLSLPLEQAIQAIRECDFDILQLEDAYVLGVRDLPLLHKDPFDRLLISTAIAEGITIVTADENVKKYDVSCVF
jgi:PIN domain nuclease of toxin-antitoxin system